MSLSYYYTPPPLLFFSAIAASKNGWFIVVADTRSHTIKRVDMTTGETRLIAGSPGVQGYAEGTGRAARFDSPAGVALCKNDSVAIVADGTQLSNRLLEYI